MQIHKVIKPEFVKKFSCVGSDCLMSCCQGWRITIDKKTHHAYLTSKKPEIARLAKENLLRERKDKNVYSVVKLDERGQCPFLDEKKLCLVHRELGEKALSICCSVYPRTKIRYADVTRHSLTLSCPEVARRVMFDADSMLLHEEDKLFAKAKNNLKSQQKPVNQIHEVVHLFAWHILQASSSSIEENLMALVNFMVYLDRIKFDLHRHFEKVEQYHKELLSGLNAGINILNRSTHPGAIGLKVRALSVLGKLIANHSIRDNIIREAHLKMAMYLNLAENPDKQVLAEKFSTLNKQWEMLCQDSFLSAPHVLRNLLTYKIYHTHFPGTDFSTAMRQVYRLILDYFYIKHLLSVKSLEVTPDETMALKIVASLAEKTMHSSVIDLRMDKAIEMINAGDDLSCILLIS